MFQLSLDGRRLYVTTSLFSTWDNQFYPEIRQKGGVMVKEEIVRGLVSSLEVSDSDRNLADLESTRLCSTCATGRGGHAPRRPRGPPARRSSWARGAPRPPSRRSPPRAARHQHQGRCDRGPAARGKTRVRRRTFRTGCRLAKGRHLSSRKCPIAASPRQGPSEGHMAATGCKTSSQTTSLPAALPAAPP